MIFIVEGIDRVGKTTLIDRFIKSTNIKKFNAYFPELVPPSKFDNFNETDKYLREILLCKMFESDIVFDRLHLTDFVYGCIERHYDFTAALENFKLIERELLSQKAMLILVKPTDIKLSSQSHGKDLSVHEGLFEMAYNMSKLTKIKCDYTTLLEAENIMKNALRAQYSGVVK